MVDSIKQSTHALIKSKGISDREPSTTSIARHAGISVGSLYQYFSTREAIFLALYEDTSTEVVVTMKKVAVRILNQPLEKGVAEIVRYLLDLHRQHELILLGLVRQIPELKLASQPMSYENMIFDSIRIAVKQWVPELSPHDLNRRAFFLREIMLSGIYRYLNDRPEDISDREFIADMTAIVGFYIAHGPVTKRR